MIQSVHPIPSPAIPTLRQCFIQAKKKKKSKWEAQTFNATITIFPDRQVEKRKKASGKGTKKVRGRC
jgi:hypothetical protein